MNNGSDDGPMIISSGGSMGNIYEMTPFNIKFTGSGVDKVLGIRILDYRENKGVSVNKKGATIIGQYEDSFVFVDNLFYIQKGQRKQAKKFEDVEAEESDVYLWIPPKKPEIFEYVVQMDYVITGEDGGSVTGSITQTLIHSVMSNYTYFAKQVRKLIDIRREAYRGRNIV